MDAHLYADMRGSGILRGSREFHVLLEVVVEVT